MKKIAIVLVCFFSGYIMAKSTGSEFIKLFNTDIQYKIDFSENQKTGSISFFKKDFKFLEMLVTEGKLNKMSITSNKSRDLVRLLFNEKELSSLMVVNNKWENRGQSPIFLIYDRFCTTASNMASLLFPFIY